MKKVIPRTAALLRLSVLCLTSLFANAQVTTTFISSPNSTFPPSSSTIDWADAEIRQGSAPGIASTNYGTVDQIGAAYWSPTKIRSLFRINVADMIPTGTVLQNAKLVLTYNSSGLTGAMSNSGANAFYLQRVTQAWKENIVTWNNQPATVTTSQIAVPASTGGALNLEIDITTMLQDMLDHPETNYGFMMKLQDESVQGARTFAGIDFSTATSRPKLVVVTAQPISKSQAQRDYIFGGLDQTSINSGILTDYGFDLANPTLYDGVIRTNNEMTIDSWRALLAEFLSSTINPSSNLKSLKIVNDTLDNKWKSSDPANRIIDVPVQFVRYQTLRSDAITQNLISNNNNRLLDVPGRTQSPYITNYAFGAAPTMTYDADGRVLFRFPTSVFINSSDKAMTDFSVDFDDGGGYRTVSLNTPISIQYGVAGIKTLRFRLTVTGNISYYSHASFQVYSVDGIAAKYAKETSHAFKFPRSSDSACPESFPNPELYQGSLYGATVTVAYGTQTASSRPSLSCSPQLIRPLIVIEGFDVSNFSAFGGDNWDFKHFIQNGVNGGIASITSDGNDLNSRLDIAGYDLVFIDFSEGTGDIIRNAYLVENVIQWVNAHKINNPSGQREKNVVLGQSMGGLIGRYAVCDLEKRRIATPAFPAHECRLLITQDSPHRGANVPLGFQSLVNNLATQSLTSIGLFTYGTTGAIVGSFLDMQDLVPALKQAKHLLNEPATRQMLIIQDGQTNTFLDGEYRTMITFNAGYTPTFSSQALSNGSECGHGQVISPSAELFYANASLFVNPLLFTAAADIITGAQGIPPAQRGLGALTDVPFHLLIPFTGKTWKTNMVVKSTDASGTGEVFSGKFSLEKKILFLIPISITLFQSSTSVSNVGFWDGQPGGFYNLQSKKAKISGVDINAYPIVQANLTVRVAPLFNFVPTVSALDVSSSLTPAAITSVYTGGANATYPSRFSNFKTQERNDAPAFLNSSYNSRHVQFTPTSATWLLNVLAGTNPVANCTYSCGGGSGATISGPNTLCLDPIVCTLSNIPAGNTISWSTIGDIGVPPNSHASTVTVTPAPSAGSATIVATFNSTTCGETSTSKTLSFLNPSWPQESMNSDGTPSYIYQGPDPVFFVGQETMITVIDYPAKTGPIEVVADGYISGSGPGYCVVTFNMPGTYTVRATAPAPCGYIDVYQVVTVIGGSGRIAGSDYSYYPNPASNSLTIIADPTTRAETNVNSSTVKESAEVKLMDAMGTVVKSNFGENNSSITLDTADLPNGLYYLTLSKGDKTYSQQIIIKH